MVPPRSEQGGLPGGVQLQECFGQVRKQRELRKTNCAPVYKLVFLWLRLSGCELALWLLG